MSVLYLASSSPRRRDLLSSWGYSFEVIENRLGVETLPLTGTKRRVYHQLKALSLSKAKVSSASIKGVVLSADTIILFRRHVLGKPSDLAHAKEMLHALSGSTHEVITAVTILDTVTLRQFSFTSTTHVWFRDLSESLVSSYCDDYPVLDKAGAYGIQDVQDRFVKRIEGLYSTVLGLPQHPLMHCLRLFGITPERGNGLYGF